MKPSQTGNIGGIEYEKKVLGSAKLIEAEINNTNRFEVLEDVTTGFNAHEVDLKILVLKNQTFNLEIKMDKMVQMGGTSCRYDKTTESFSPAKKDSSKFDLIEQILSNKTNELNRLVDFLHNQKPLKLHNNISGFPMRVTREAWAKAQENGLLVNSYIEESAKWISDHYNKKGIYYIQIGKSGLYYLNKNILNLSNIPSLDELKIKLLIRTARGGSDWHTIGGKHYKIGTALIRVQGRLDGKNLRPSPVSFDYPESILTLLNERN
jgi:hypothetical protein